MRDKSSTELFQIVRDGTLEHAVQARTALDELEERWHSGRTGNPAAHVSLRLARVEKDLAAFKRAHAEHVHTWSPDFFTTGYARKVEDRPDLLPSLSLLEPPRYR